MLEVVLALALALEEDTKRKDCRPSGGFSDDGPVLVLRPRKSMSMGMDEIDQTRIERLIRRLFDNETKAGS